MHEDVRKSIIIPVVSLLFDRIITPVVIRDLDLHSPELGTQGGSFACESRGRSWAATFPSNVEGGEVSQQNGEILEQKS